MRGRRRHEYHCAFSAPLLRLSNIIPSTARHSAFRLSIDVQRGHIVCLLGRQCQRQSTTMKIILGLETALGRTDLRRCSRSVLTTPQDRSARHSSGAGGAPAVRGYERERKHPDGASCNDSGEVAGSRPVLRYFPNSGNGFRTRGSLSGGEQQIGRHGPPESRPRMIVM